MNPALLRSACVAPVLSVSFSLLTASEAAAATASAPYPTGSHLQLVRQFHTTKDGLPADDIRAVTVTRGGLVFAAGGTGLARRNGERWSEQSGPTGVTALFAPTQGPEALAGASNGVWAFHNGQWQREADSPARAIAFAAEPDGTPWALAPGGVFRRTNGWIRVHDLDDDDLAGPRSLLPSGAQDVLVAAESGLFGLMGKRRYWMSIEVRPGGLLSPRTRALARLDATHFLVATDRGFNVSNGTRAWQAFTGAEGLPIVDLTHLAVAADGIVWLGSQSGLVRWQEGQWTYLAGQRWLPDDRVNAIAPATGGAAWIGTPKGLAHLHLQKLTLTEKADRLQQTLERRDRRHGFVTEMELPAPGVLDGAVQELSDNERLWTSLYIASQSFRYAVTQSPEARAQAWRSMQALLRLESITGLTGFPARALCHVNEPQFSRRSLRSSPEWHASPVEKDWFWKGETSSDEIDGHYFGWYVFHELAADEDQKRQVRATCQRVTDHILDHGYHLVDHDGQPTTWGVWAPEKLNGDPKWWQERGLNSLEILSHLKVAAHLVGGARYENAYRDLVQNHAYALNTLNAKLPTGVSHDNQLLFLAYYPLLQLERDPGLRALYTASLRRSWDLLRAEGSPLWNFIQGASTGASCDVEAAVSALREIPLDFIQWKTRNSHRADLQFDPAPGRHGTQRLRKPLPWTERVIHNWDKSPFLLDSGSDRVEADPTIWLLPYWLGRHHRLID